MQFEFPELLILAIPAWLLFRRVDDSRGVTKWLRLTLLPVLLLALTGPRINVGGSGVDVVVVADRSLSLTAGTHANIRELIQNLENHVASEVSRGDRVSLVTFGSDARVEYELSARNSSQDGYLKDVNPNGSDLDAAILTALDRVNPDRPARIIVLSDGEATGREPSSAARRAREQGVPVDCRVFERLDAGDLSVESVLLPQTIVPREPFQYSVWIHADREADAAVRVLRDGREIARKEQHFDHGMNRVLFRDLLEDGGSHAYSVELLIDDDPVAENNVGAGAVLVDAGPRVLLLNPDGQAGQIGDALTAARIPFDVSTGTGHLLSQASLDRYRAVVLENVPADDLGRLKMERLAQFVEDLGGGLMMTGGKSSFGAGGYFRSPLEDVLPVSMELREEHRKMRVAIAVALDRSGSMTASVAGGKTKMDLANLGTAEVVKLLSPQDMIAVIAVDSSPHVIQKMTRVDNPAAIASRVRKIESMGGGIFVYEALVAAGKELMKAGGYSTRHIILFSDAADSEVPGAYKALLKKYAAAGITCSVIGLGTTADSDAKLLEDIAKLGSGNIMFSSDAKELPRLFTQDTMSIARNTFIVADEEEQPNGFPGELIADARLMGNLGTGAFPNTKGYNLSYLKPDATAAVLSRDEYEAPWSSFWYRGLGRVAAITLEVDGEHTGAFGQWDNYEDFIVTHVRWLLGSGDPDDVYVKIEQAGQDAVVSVELDPDRPGQDETKPPTLVIVPPGREREAVIEPDFVWTGPHSLQARFPLNRTGTYRTLVRTGDRRFARGPAVTLPYSPEFAPRIGLPDGPETLERISELSGGVLRTDVLEVFNDPPRSARTYSLLVPLMIAGICLLLIEIAGRRLALWQRLVDVTQPSLPKSAIQPASPEKQAAAGWFSSWRKKAQRTKARPAPTQPTAVSARTDSAPPAPQPSPPQSSASAKSVFEQAKKRAQRRLK
jgi:uncharacterized membrane protein